MNKTILLGRIGKDIELKATKGGMEVASFSLATSKKVKGEQVTQWHSLVAFGKTAETLAKYVSKGDQLLVEGEIQYRSYDNREGQKVNLTEILINQFEFVGTAGKAPKTTTESVEDMARRVFETPSGGGMSPSGFDPDDEIPFAMPRCYREEV